MITQQKILSIIILIGLIVVAFILFGGKEENGIKVIEDYHIHADIVLMVNGEKIDFSLDRYQSDEEETLHPYLHFHDDNGDVWHVHLEELTLGRFLDSLNISLNEDCLSIDEEEYCKNEDKVLNFYINGRESNKFEKYIPEDLDKVLIYYGEDSRELIDSAIETVSDDSCIYSDKCPERGSPPDESSCSVSGGCAILE